MANEIETSSKTMKPRINNYLNQNIYFKSCSVVAICSSVHLIKYFSLLDDNNYCVKHFLFIIIIIIIIINIIIIISIAIL